MRYLSLFSGLEAAHVATAPLGWECVGVSEIDPNACAILAHRLPGVPNLGSVTDITEEQIAALGPIDVVIGGSPCQDLSVAGKRAGLGGARSSLFHEQLRIFHAARTLCGARWCVWENVPGAFSSNAGRDFAAVVGSLAGCELDVPADGWGSEGVALGDNGLVEWCVLDSQWFGVAQRRRRVFAVLDAGDWASRAPVLLERDSLRGDSAPRREAGEGSAAGTGIGAACGGIAEVTGTLATSGGHAVPGTCAQDAGAGFLIALAHGQGGAEVRTDDGAPCLTCNHEAPIVAFDTTQVTSKANRSQPKPGDPCHPLAASAHPPAIAFSCKDHGADAGDTAPTLRAMGHSGSHANAGGQVAVAVGVTIHGTDPTVQKVASYDELAQCLRARTPGNIDNSSTTVVQQDMAVRRLTPREAERLQSLPDDWTLVPNAKGKPMADGPRYKALGNTFTATVIRWIARQIQMAHEQSRAAA